MIHVLPRRELQNKENLLSLFYLTTHFWAIPLASKVEYKLEISSIPFQILIKNKILTL